MTSDPHAMKEWVTVDTAQLANGSTFALDRRGDDWVVRVDERLLMSTRMHDSEIALAEEAIDRVEDPVTILVGGLGLGFTLRAVLDSVSEDAQVTVVELVPELVDWNRNHFGALNDHPLDDPRCEVIVGDVFDTIKRSSAVFDIILLDVDNGPRALAQAKNQRLYGESGVRSCRAALRPDGVIAVWSAGPNARYADKLARHAFDVEVLRVAATVGSRAKHVLFLGTR